MENSCTILAQTIIDKARLSKVTLGTVESCTGGLLGGALTSVPGSSEVYSGGFITYTNEVKSKFVAVDPVTLDRFGAVSTQVAEEMALGCKRSLEVDIAVSVTGIAGPDGGTAEKPVGMVCFAVASDLLGKKNSVQSSCEIFADLGRDAIRESAVKFGLELFAVVLSDSKGFLS